MELKETKELKVGKIEDIDLLLKERSENNAIEIEIGCGNGHFITDYGEKNRKSTLIGIDLKKKRCLKSLKKINNKDLQNIHIICGRAEEFVQRLPASKIDAFHIYFPDPWPKKRHRKRRFLKMPHIEQIYMSLKQGGKIYFSSDVFDYYLQARILFALHPGFEQNNSTPPKESYNSIFSKRFTDMGKNIFFTSYFKKTTYNKKSSQQTARYSYVCKKELREM